MARIRLALVNCESGEGPWQVVRGGEQLARVTGLEDGERVWLDIDGMVGDTRFLPVFFDRPGSYPIDLSGASRFRFRKVTNGGLVSKTCVEVITDG